MMHKRVLITGLSSDSFLEFLFLSSVLLSLSLYIRWPPGLSTYRSAFPSVLPSSSCICFLQVLLYAVLRSPFLLCQFFLFLLFYLTRGEQLSCSCPYHILLNFGEKGPWTAEKCFSFWMFPMHTRSCVLLQREGAVPRTVSLVICKV